MVETLCWAGPTHLVKIQLRYSCRFEHGCTSLLISFVLLELCLVNEIFELLNLEMSSVSVHSAQLLVLFPFQHITCLLKLPICQRLPLSLTDVQSEPDISAVGPDHILYDRCAIHLREVLPWFNALCTIISGGIHCPSVQQMQAIQKIHCPIARRDHSLLT